MEIQHSPGDKYMQGDPYMKYIILTLFTIILLGCETQNSEPMKGQPVKLKADAYTEMCIREPESPLCTNDVGVTHATDLNERLCKICAQDSSYSFCKYNQHCTNYTYTPKAEPEPEKSEPMQGEPVRIRAQAYEDLCKREPESVLCN